MIKDIVLHLSADAKHDVAAKYAVSVAETFGATLAAVTFAYETVLPATLMGGGLPVDFINEQRALAEEAPQAAVTMRKEMARRSGVAVEARLETTSLAGAADIFGHLARQFDLSIVGQANPDVVGPQELIIEAALFQSGRPVVVVPYRMGSRSIAFWCGGTEGAKRRAPSRMHCRFSTAPKPSRSWSWRLNHSKVMTRQVPTSRVIWLTRISTFASSGSSPVEPTWQTPFFPTRRMSRRISSSWADMAIRDCASSS